MNYDSQLRKACIAIISCAMMFATPFLFSTFMAVLIEGGALGGIAKNTYTSSSQTIALISIIVYLSAMGFGMKGVIALKAYLDNENHKGELDKPAEITTHEVINNNPQECRTNSWREALQQQKNTLNKLNFKQALKYHYTISTLLLQYAHFWEDENNDVTVRFPFKQTASIYLPQTFQLLNQFVVQHQTGQDVEQEINTQLLAMRHLLEKTVEENITNPAFKKLRSHSRFLSEKTSTQQNLQSAMLNETIKDKNNASLNDHLDEYFSDYKKEEDDERYHHTQKAFNQAFKK